jgi:Tfp pilus assembly protein PilO
MNTLPKEKRDRLILVGLGTAILLAVIYFFLVRPEYDSLARVQAKIAAATKDLEQKDKAIRDEPVTLRELTQASNALVQAESDVATGDPNAWIYEILRNFKGRHNVDLAQMSQSVMGDVDVLPNFPYRQIKVTVTGTAYYHDLGRFIADFENAYPHVRLLNLSLAPAAGDNTGSTNSPSEKLTFRMDVAALVKSGGGLN